MEGDNSPLECEVCGGNDFYKESGHFYCNECQTQSQQLQEHVFEQDTVNKKSSRKIQSQKTNQEEQLTSWECYNYVLKGLTEEMLSLGAKSELKVVVQCLWMKYLHKCEVFKLHSNDLPKINIFGSKKDIAVLYNLKKHKRKSSRASSASTTLSVRRERSRKTQALVKSHYEEQSLSQSQDLTQESLISLKNESASSEGSSRIKFDQFTEDQFTQRMSRRHFKQHEEDLEGDLTCHKIAIRSLSTHIRANPTNLTSYVLYEIIYIGLLIIGDSIQLGDMLRFLKEGHLSFACYRHFLPKGLSEKSLNLPQRREKLLNHATLRKRCAKLVHFLGVSAYICTPDLLLLCSRYCNELNLPDLICDCVQSILECTKPKMALKQSSRSLPNYEGRAMSLVLFTLKLLFGLDGVTEKKLSEYSYLINTIDSSHKMFDFLEWLEFIKLRSIVVSQHYLPSALRDSVESSMYLKYLKSQKVKFRGSSRPIHSETQDYLAVLERLLLKQSIEHPLFKATLTPYEEYYNLVSNNLTKNRSFRNTSIDHLLNPQMYLKALGTYSIEHKGANNNIIVEPYLYLYINKYAKSLRSTVVVDMNPVKKHDQYISDYLNKENTPTTDSKVLQENWAEFYKGEFSRHQDLIGRLLPSKASILYPHHYNPFQRYWLNLPVNPLAVHFSEQHMEELANKMPVYLREVIEECARVVEQKVNDFYGEFIITELFLANFDFLKGVRKEDGREVLELRNTLNSMRGHW